MQLHSEHHVRGGQPAENCGGFSSKVESRALCRAYVVEGERTYRKCNAWGATTPIRRRRRADEFWFRLVYLRRGRVTFVYDDEVCHGSGGCHQSRTGVLMSCWAIRVFIKWPYSRLLPSAAAPDVLLAPTQHVASVIRLVRHELPHIDCAAHTYPRLLSIPPLVHICYLLV